MTAIAVNVRECVNLTKPNLTKSKMTTMINHLNVFMISYMDVIILPP